MAKLTIEEIPQPKPPKKYVLEMNEEEAGTVMSVLGTITGDKNECRTTTDGVFRALLGDAGAPFESGSLRHSASFHRTNESLRQGRPAQFK